MAEKMSTPQTMENPCQSRWLFPEEPEPLKEHLLQQAVNGGRSDQRESCYVLTISTPQLHLGAREWHEESETKE